MRKSLLMMVLATWAGSIGIAQACATQADATTSRPWASSTFQPALASASASNDAVKAAVDALVVSKTTKTVRTENERDKNQTMHATQRNGAELVADTSNRSDAQRLRADPDMLPPAVGFDGNGQPQPAASTSTNRHPDLGWQSLLPGSIQ